MKYYNHISHNFKPSPHPATAASLKMTPGPSVFGEILASRIASKADQHSPFKPSYPVTAEKLQQLIASLRSQMNLLSLRSFNESNSDDDLGGLASDWLNTDLSLWTLTPKSPNRMQTAKNNQPLNQIDGIIRQASKTYAVAPQVIKAIVRAESDFDPSATSSKGAMGLMQLMPGTAQELGVKDPYNPRENIMAGTRYFKQLLDRYQGRLPLALAAYNWGIGNLEKRPHKLPQETRTYISRVERYIKSS